MIPVELLTMGASTLVGGAMKLWSMSIESKREQNLAQINAMQQQQAMIQDARQDKTLQWTRRTIAILSVLSIVVLPKVAAIFDVPVTYGWTEWSSGFWFFTEGENIVQWHQQMGGGILLTPLDTHLVSAIIGLYFGGSLVGHK